MLELRPKKSETLRTGELDPDLREQSGLADNAPDGVLPPMASCREMPPLLAVTMHTWCGELQLADAGRCLAGQEFC